MFGEHSSLTQKYDQNIVSQQLNVT